MQKHAKKNKIIFVLKECVAVRVVYFSVFERRFSKSRGVFASFPLSLFKPLCSNPVASPVTLPGLPCQSPCWFPCRPVGSLVGFPCQPVLYP